LSNRAVAIASLVFLMLVWGSTFVVTKAAVAETPPMLAAFLRFIVAAVVLLPLAVIRGGFKRLPRPLPLGTMLLMGVTGFVLYYAGFNYAIAYASASQGALIQALIPAVIALAAVLFLHERPSRKRWIGIALSIAGVALVVSASGSETPEMFEKFLPYAMALGVEDNWAKAFDGIYREPPQWYTGHGGVHAFRPSAFTSDLGRMSTHAAAAMPSSPRSSGGSGFSGGSSGGGFGGGGGGGF
jgi:uncharacterized membrane protein